ncbi:hypothetical protein ACQPZJ_14505 [Actinoplanes sp. CA-054009]
MLIVVELSVGVWQYMFDVAGLGLGFVVALLFSAVTLQYRIVRASLVALAVYAGVHFVYQVLQFGSATRWVDDALLVEFLLAVGLLALTPRLRRRPRANTGCDLPDDDAFRCHA